MTISSLTSSPVGGFRGERGTRLRCRCGVTARSNGALRCGGLAQARPGRIIHDLGEHVWDVAELLGVLENLDQEDEFVTVSNERDGVGMAYMVIDDDSAFQMLCRELPGGNLRVRLYESYLQNVGINTERSL